MRLAFGLGRMPSPILPASSKLDEQTALASILFVSRPRVPRAYAPKIRNGENTTCRLKLSIPFPNRSSSP
jgi:hypothetical protein